MRLNFKHRRYIAGQFIKDQLDGGSYDVWSVRNSITRKYSKEIRELLLQCMELVRGEGFVEYFKRNEGMFKQMWRGTSISPSAIGIKLETIVDYLKEKVKIPKQRYPGWELSTLNVGRYIPNVNLQGAGIVPDLSEFCRDYEIYFPKSVWDSEPFREIQNMYLKVCVEYCSSPAELVDYFCGSDWDEFRLDLRTFLMPQGIKTTEDLKKEFPKYYEILATDFRREIC